MITLEYTRELIRNIKPELSYQIGEDYEAWKAKARKKLSEILSLDKMIPAERKVEIDFERCENGVREIRFRFQSEPGYFVPCHLFLPEGVENPPLVIALQGHSTGMHISWAEVRHECDKRIVDSYTRCFCPQALDRKCAVVAMEQRNFGELAFEVTGHICYEGAMNSLLLGRNVIGERVWDVMRLIDVLETDMYRGFDLSKLVLMGHSGGGTATAYTAAMEDRIKIAVSSCGMATYKGSISALHHCSCNYVPGIVRYFEMSDLALMAFPKYFVQVNGNADDNNFPEGPANEIAKTVKEGYTALGRPDAYTHIMGNGGHDFYADEAWPVIEKYLKELG